MKHRRNNVISKVRLQKAKAGARSAGYELKTYGPKPAGLSPEMQRIVDERNIQWLEMLAKS